MVQKYDTSHINAKVKTSCLSVRRFSLYSTSPLTLTGIDCTLLLPLTVCGLPNGRSGSAPGTVQGDPGADRTTVAASTSREDGMKMQNGEIRLHQKRGGRPWYGPDRHKTGCKI